MTSFIIETARTKCISGEALKVRGKKFDKLSLKILQKALKWPLHYANFPEEHAPYPPRVVLALKLLKNNSAAKNTLEKSDEY